MARKFKDRYTKKEKHEEGKKWKIVGRFPEFKNADELRNMLVDDDENDVKVHRHYKNDVFVVKMRKKSYRLKRDESEKLQN